MTKGVIESIAGEFYVWATCPYCEEENELTDGDMDGFLYRHINDGILNFQGSYIRTCHRCEQEFTITGLEY